MRVLYSFPDEIGRPGIGTTAFNQVREVAARGVDVTLYCTSKRGELPDNVDIVQTLSIGGRRVPHRVMGIERSYRYHDRRVARALGRMDGTIDVVHCWPKATVHTARAARRLGIPALREVPNTHTAHAFEVVAQEVERLGLPPTKGHSHTFDLETLALEEEEYAIADALLVPSEYSLDTFLDRGFSREKLLLHRYGYDPSHFFAGAARAHEGAERPFTAIFVGRCEPRKGVHHALRAWLDSGASEGDRFIICGVIDPAYEAVLGPLLADPSIEVMGFVDDPGALMRESDVFVLPSLEEGSALVTYEARACGCVLAVSDAAGARAQDGVEALVHSPGDVAALTDHLTRLRRDSALLERLRAASLAGLSDLTWSAAGKELETIYAGQARHAAGRAA